MNIEIQDGFKIIREKNKITLLVESDRLQEYIDYAKKNSITSLSLQGYHGYKLPDVEFLAGNDFLTSLWVVKDINPIDISGIRHLRQLKQLNVSNDGQPVDFSFFPQLEEAYIDWNNKIINLTECPALRKLTIWKYKPRSKAFHELLGLANLESLEITQSNIESFDGFGELTGLRSFEAHYLSKLSILDGLEASQQHLRMLMLHTCKKLVGHEHILGQLKMLEKLILSDCGGLNHLTFINKLQNLKFFSFVGTDVKDGDLLPLIKRRLEYAGFDNKKHYSHKMEEINGH
jgi:hypothetical protein